MIMWYGNLNIKWGNKLQKIVNMGSMIPGKLHKQLSIFMVTEAEKIIHNYSHPLCSEFELLLSKKI